VARELGVDGDRVADLVGGEALWIETGGRSQPNGPSATSRREGRPSFKPGSERSSANGAPARA